MGIARGYFDENIRSEIKRCLEVAAKEIGIAKVRSNFLDIPVELPGKAADLRPLVMKAETSANHTQTMRAREDEYSVEVANRPHAGFSFPLPTTFRL